MNHMRLDVPPLVGGTGYGGKHERSCEHVTLTIGEGLGICGQKATERIRRDDAYYPPFTACHDHAWPYLQGEFGPEFKVMAL